MVLDVVGVPLKAGGAAFLGHRRHHCHLEFFFLIFRPQNPLRRNLYHRVRSSAAAATATTATTASPRQILKPETLPDFPSFSFLQHLMLLLLIYLNVQMVVKPNWRGWTWSQFATSRPPKFLGGYFFTMIRIMFYDFLCPGTLVGPVRDKLIFVCFANFVCQFFQIRVISPEDLPGRLADNISVL